jgi:hypothetical protein
VTWEQVRPSRTPHDGESPASLEDLLTALVKSKTDGKQPVVVWVCDTSATRVNQKLKEWIFDDELLGIALNRVRCLEITLGSIPDEKLKEAVKKKLPLFSFHDPAGARTDRLEGKDAKSTLSFSKALEKLWNASYDLKFREFSRKMLSILDRFDKLQKIKRKSKAKTVKKVEDKILEDERKLLAKCTLKKKYVSKAN